MKRKEILEKRLSRLESKKAEMIKRSQESEDVNEVRSINNELEDINAEIEETKAEIDAIEEEARSVEVESRSEIPADAKLVNGTVKGSFKPEESRSEDKFSSMEYRKAFMDYAQRGIKNDLIMDSMKAFQMRSGAEANTDTLGALIPTTLIEEFINEVKKVYGQLYNKVRKLNVKGGVRYPIGELEASFRWISEDTVSPNQNGGETEDVIFEYNIGEIRVAQSLLSSIVSLELFENEVVQIMVKAFLQGMDIGIVKGTGRGQMLGILNDSRVTNEISMSAADMNDWTKWRKNFFAKLPLGYRAGEFIFPLSTVETYLETMADANNNPVFRQATGLEVNDGDAVNPNGRFFGREISLVEPDVIPDFDSANAGDVIGIFWQPESYAINSNMAMGMRRYFDEDANKWVNKLLVVADGKVLNPKGFYLIKKKA